MGILNSEEDRLRKELSDLQDEIDKLEQENERLRKQVASEKEDGFAEGMERAAEIAEPYNEWGSWGKIIARAIRAEIEK